MSGRQSSVLHDDLLGEKKGKKKHRKGQCIFNSFRLFDAITLKSVRGKNLKGLRPIPFMQTYNGDVSPGCASHFFSVFNIFAPFFLSLSLSPSLFKSCWHSLAPFICAPLSVKNWSRYDNSFRSTSQEKVHPPRCMHANVAFSCFLPFGGILKTWRRKKCTWQFCQEPLNVKENVGDSAIPIRLKKRRTIDVKFKGFWCITQRWND